MWINKGGLLSLPLSPPDLTPPTLVKIPPRPLISFFFSLSLSTLLGAGRKNQESLGKSCLYVVVEGGGEKSGQDAFFPKGRESGEGGGGRRKKELCDVTMKKMRFCVVVVVRGGGGGGGQKMKEGISFEEGGSLSKKKKKRWGKKSILGGW